MDNKVQEQNIQQGEINEEKVLNFLNRDDIEWKRTTKFDIFDYKHKTRPFIIELKSRNNLYTDYPDWQIGMNKIIQIGKDRKNNTYFIFFLFYDGLYKWKYSLKNLINDCVVKDGGTIKRGRNELTENVFIDAKKLEFITDTICNIPIDTADEGCLL
jgi:hypothetical protein